MSEYYIAGIPCSAELYHHGVLGQKWGRRRYQNEDGSLTSLGRIHYGYGKAKDAAKIAVKSAASYAKEGAKLTGKGIALVAKYGTYPIRRRHSSLLTKKEMKRLMERYEIESQYKRAKLAARGEGFTKRLLDDVGKLAYKGVETLVTETAKSASKDVASRMMETRTERKARKIKNKADKIAQEAQVYNRKIERDKAKESYESGSWREEKTGGSKGKKDETKTKDNPQTTESPKQTEPQRPNDKERERYRSGIDSLLRDIERQENAAERRRLEDEAERAALEYRRRQNLRRKNLVPPTW